MEEQNKIPKEGLKKEDDSKDSQGSDSSDDIRFPENSEDEEFLNVTSVMFSKAASGEPFNFVDYYAESSRCRYCPGYISPAAAAILQKAFELGAYMPYKDAIALAQPEATDVQPNQMCTPNQNHVKCRCCMQLMPDQRNAATNPPAAPQKCEVCLTAFCNLYWKCSKEGCKGCLNEFKDMVFEDNCLDRMFTYDTLENKIFKNHLLSKNKTWKDVLNECLAKLDSGEYALPGHLTSDTIICRKCALQNFGTLAYFYRSEISRDELSDAVKMRPDCH